MKRLFFATFLAVALTPFTFSADADAQGVSTIRGKDKVMYKKNMVIDFEEGSVEGDLVKPEGGYMVNRGRAKFNSLINIRSSFAQEMWQNARKL